MYHFTVRELPSFTDGMCYLIQSNLTLIADGNQGDELIITAKKLPKQNDIRELNVWLTDDYDYLAATHQYWAESRPLKINLPFGNHQIPLIKYQEFTHTPLKCKDFDHEYISLQQCLANTFNTKDFAPCNKCIPIQMQGFRYVNNSLNIPNCTSLDDEICNGGPHVWTRLPNITESQCLMPCNITGTFSTNTGNAQAFCAFNQSQFNLNSVT